MSAPEITIQTIQNLLSQIPWTETYFFIRFLFIFLDILLVIGIIFAFERSLAFRPPFSSPRHPERKPLTQAGDEARERWNTIIDHSELSPPHSLTLAIIEADSFTDSVLKKLGIQGETMADRLERLKADEIRSLESVWEAHKTRNEIVHTPGTEIEENAARRHLQNYENFLKEIGIL